MRASAISDLTRRAEVRDTWPFFLIVIAMVVAGYLSALRSQPALQNPFGLIVYTVLALLMIGLFVISPIGAIKGRGVILVLAQAGVSFAIGLMTPHHWLVLGLYPAVVGMAIGLFWGELLPIFSITGLCVALASANLVIAGGVERMATLLPTFAASLLFVFVYVILFVRQLNARQQAQDAQVELEAANRRLRDYAERVEELTLSQERERMGRELHDTLAQGLAGLILQLEAIDSDVEDGNTERARKVLQEAMARARSSLAEARRAIMALRAAALEHGSLETAVAAVLDQFAATNGIDCERSVALQEQDLEPEEAQDLLRILQECLTNVGRHAHATSVTVKVVVRGRVIEMSIEDDGAGFDGTEVEHRFGIAGMHERAARLEAELVIDSAPERGTRVSLRSRRAAP